MKFTIDRARMRALVIMLAMMVCMAALALSPSAARADGGGGGGSGSGSGGGSKGGSDCRGGEQSVWCLRSSPVRADYTGWAYVNSGTCATPSCTYSSATIFAWVWNVKGYTAGALPNGALVWTVPYGSAGWAWAWTQQSGWTVVQAQHVWYPWGASSAADS